MQVARVSAIFLPADDILSASGHYVENTSKTEKLIWIELYKSDHVADISLTQWLALTPPDIVANTLNISLAVVKNLKKEKQILLAAEK